MTNEIKEILDKRQLRLMCNDIYEGGDWQTMIDYITNLQEENKKLEKRNKEIYEGFMATTQELCEYAEKIDKAVEYIENDYDKNEEVIDYFNLNSYYDNILKILRGDE